MAVSATRIRTGMSFQRRLLLLHWNRREITTRALQLSIRRGRGSLTSRMRVQNTPSQHSIATLQELTLGEQAVLRSQTPSPNLCGVMMKETSASTTSKEPTTLASISRNYSIILVRHLPQLRRPISIGHSRVHQTGISTELHLGARCHIPIMDINARVPRAPVDGPRLGSLRAPPARLLRTRP